MARPKGHPLDTVEEVDAEAKRPRIDRSIRKVANLLKEVGACYRDAGAALMRDDGTEYAASLELADTYLALVAKLTTKTADAITAEGFAGIQEG